MKTLKVAFRRLTKDAAVVHSITLSNQSTVGDMINHLKTKVELSHPDAELRLLEIFNNKIWKIFLFREKIEDIYCKLLAEEIPEEEKMGPQDHLIPVYHFTKDGYLARNFGEPFLIIIHEGETLCAVKLRIQKILQVPGEEFAKWKLAFFSSLRQPEYLQDSDIVSSHFQRRDESEDYGAREQELGLEHSDSWPKRTYAAVKNI